MEEQFVPYELAVKLKELGFDEICFTSYCLHWKDLQPYLWKLNQPDYGEYWDLNSKIEAPLWQQAFDWFREKHNLNIQPFAVWESEYEEIDFIKNKPSFYTTDDFIYNKNKSIENSDKFKTYEEARIACLEKLIETCKKR